MDAENSSQTDFSPCLTMAAFIMRQPRQTDISTPIHFFPAGLFFPEAALRLSERRRMGTILLPGFSVFSGREAGGTGAYK
jgi:hypothetical protein